MMIKERETEIDILHTHKMEGATLKNSPAGEIH